MLVSPAVLAPHGSNPSLARSSNVLVRLPTVCPPSTSSLPPVYLQSTSRLPFVHLSSVFHPSSSVELVDHSTCMCSPVGVLLASCWRPVAVVQGCWILTCRALVLLFLPFLPSPPFFPRVRAFSAHWVDCFASLFCVFTSRLHLAYPLGVISVMTRRGVGPNSRCWTRSMNFTGVCLATTARTWTS